MNDDRPVVLIVDDEPLNLEVLAKVLQSDCRIKVATDGPAALALARLDPYPDLILLDVMMPEMDGYAVCAALKRTALTALIPVIFITARMDPESETLALSGGAVDFIHKPINPAVVRARVRLQIELAEHRGRLEALVQTRTLELAQARDAAESANRAKDAFLANIGHEFRTPLNHITGMAYVLRKAVPQGREQDFLANIEGAARRILDLVNDVIDVSRLEAKLIPIASREFDLRKLLDEFIQDSVDLATAKGLLLCPDLDPALPGAVHGDPVHLRQVLARLLGNAVKFSTHGRISLRVRPIATQGGHVWVRFEVQDQGIGISPEVQSGLFALFTQGDTSLTRLHGGAGLGLALCRRLVTLMGGEIGLVSAPGQGTTVWFQIPLGIAGA